MSNNLQSILQAIHMVKYEGIKEVSIKTEDLSLLRAEILEQRATMARLRKEVTKTQKELAAQKIEIHYFDTYV